MVNLVDYYKNNIKNDDYYYRFYDDLVYEEIKGNSWLYDDLDFVDDKNELYEIFDLEEAIKKFKDLCEPSLNINDYKNKKWFYLLAFYLYRNGYFIEEFPHVLERPPLEPTNFTYNNIRDRAFELGLDENGTVRYQIRRKIVTNLNFKRKNENLEIEEDINLLFKKISTRNAQFEEMSSDEKLKEIGNLIENMLKENGDYKKLDYKEIGFDYIDDEIIKKYRKQVQCFRHATEEALDERKNFSVEQKLFLIDYGIVIIKTIYKLIWNPVYHKRAKTCLPYKNKDN